MSPIIPERIGWAASRLPSCSSTLTRRRSAGSRTRRTKPLASSRSMTPVMAPVVSPVSSARRPAVSASGEASSSSPTHSQSVAWRPSRSAQAWFSIAEALPSPRPARSMPSVTSLRVGGVGGVPSVIGTSPN